MASWTVAMEAASSSGISVSNSSSMAMINSTVSRESAPRSSMKEAPGTTLSASTPNCSTMMSLTLPSNSEKSLVLGRGAKAGLGAKAAAPAKRVKRMVLYMVIEY